MQSNCGNNRAAQTAVRQGFFGWQELSHEYQVVVAAHAQQPALVHDALRLAPPLCLDHTLLWIGYKVFSIKVSLF
jgi:hypothetical protein